MTSDFPCNAARRGNFTLVDYSVKSHKTVNSYLSALRQLHDLCSSTSTAFDDIKVMFTLKGLAKAKRHIPSRKLPITPDLHLKFRSRLDFRNSAHLALWADLLVGFFTFFRTANLCPTSKNHSPRYPPLCRKEITFTSWGTAVTVSRTKTHSLVIQPWSFQFHAFPTPLSVLFRPYTFYFRRSTFPTVLPPSHSYQLVFTATASLAASSGPASNGSLLALA